VACVVSGCGCAALAASAQTIAWHDDFEAAAAAAKQTLNPILVEVSCGGCPGCQDVCIPACEKLRRSFADPRVVELAKSFECARAKTQKARADEPFQRFRQFKIALTPAVLLLEPDERTELVRLGGPVTADELAGWMAPLAELGQAHRDLKADPEDGDALAAIGHVYFRLDKYEPALVYLRKALATDGEFRRREDAELDAAICELLADPQAMRTPQEAPRWLGDLEAFVRAHPNSPRRGEALFHLSTAYVRVRNTEAAEDCLQRLIAAEPIDSKWRGVAEESLPRMQMPRLTAELRGNPDNAMANYRVGHALVMMGELREALMPLTRALQFDPEGAAGVRPDATLDVAICYCRIDLTAGPRLQHFLRTYGTSPRVPEALYYLAEWADSQGATEQALEAAHTLVNDHPQSPWAHKVRDLLERIQPKDAAQQ
jgi:tetratricopeptide (TPR) repeat protein